MNRPTLIIGGGVIGLAIGWDLVRNGEDVTILERSDAGRAASWKAGGMLAPDAELQFEEPDLYRMNRESLRRWPDFVRALENDTGRDLGFRTEGTLTVADDRDAAAALKRQYTFQRDEGLDVTWLTGDEARDLEPLLSPNVVAAVRSEDYQVDNRALVEALIEGFRQHGGVLREDTPVRTIEPDHETPAVLTGDGERIEGRRLILAAGAWSRQLDGLPSAHRPPVRPVKGQVLDLRMERPFDLGHVVRGPDAYLVPKRGNRLVLGATSEEMGFDTEVTAGGLYGLLEGAWEVAPTIRELSIVEVTAGLRPGTRDSAPILGTSEAPGVIMATGHYRHGILLTPITAQEIATLVRDGTTSDWIAPFQPDRFSAVA